MALRSGNDRNTTPQFARPLHLQGIHSSCSGGKQAYLSGDESDALREVEAGAVSQPLLRKEADLTKISDSVQ